MRLRYIFPVAVLLFGAGCETSGDALRGEAVVRDSAGIRIVEIPDPVVQDPGERWRLGSEPLARIGATGTGPEQFAGIRGVVARASGDIAVLDGATSELRFFAADGSYIRTVGGQGSGPGEFTFPMGPFPLGGDSLVVYDFALRRLTVYDEAGEVARIATSELPLPQTIIGFLDGDRLVGSSGITTVQPDDPEGVRVNEQVFMAVDLANSTVDTLAVYEGARLLQWSSETFGMGVTSVPFTVDPEAALQGERLVVALGMIGEIHSMGQSGGVEAIVRLGLQRDMLPSSRFDAEVDRRIQGAAEDMQPEVRRRFAAMDAPQWVPSHTRIEVGPNGHVWVQHFRDDYRSGISLGEPSLWTVLDRDGVVVGEVELPPNFALHQVTSEGVLGVWRDDLRVEHVVHFPLDT